MLGLQSTSSRDTLLPTDDDNAYSARSNAAVNATLGVDGVAGSDDGNDAASTLGVVGGNFNAAAVDDAPLKLVDSARGGGVDGSGGVARGAGFAGTSMTGATTSFTSAAAAPAPARAATGRDGGTVDVVVVVVVLVIVVAPPFDGDDVDATIGVDARETDFGGAGAAVGVVEVVAVVVDVDVVVVVAALAATDLISESGANNTS